MSTERSGLAETLAGLTLAERTRLEARLRARAQPVPVPAIPRRSTATWPVPLSLSQERLWIADRLHPGSPAYNVPLALRLSGALDVPALTAALRAIGLRHEALRTTFPMVDGRPIQRVTAQAPALELREVAAEEVEALVASEARRPFDLAQGPLVRFLLLRASIRAHVLLVVAHHMVVDGWSLGVFGRELAVLYRAFVEGRPAPLPAPAIQYGDFTAWQRERLSQGGLESQLAYWKQQLGGQLPAPELPYDHPRPEHPSPRGGRLSFQLSEALSSRVRELCRGEGATLFMVLLAAFQTLLHRYTGATDILTGTSIANRDRLEVQPLIGLFFNNLVLRGDLSGEPTFRALIARTRAVALAAFAQQDVPWTLLVDSLHPARQGNASPIFQTLFEVHNTPLPELALPGLHVEADSVGTGTAKVDLVLDMWASDAHLAGVFVYSAERFEHATIVRLARHFETLLAAASAWPDRRLSELALLESAEARALVHDWNPVDVARPTGCATERLAACAARHPRAVAIVAGQQQITYAELDQRANRIAQRLHLLGVGPESRIGLCLPRSPELLVALVGILAAGAAFVPLDPSYPTERLAVMMADAQVRAVIASHATRASLAGCTVPLLFVDDEAGQQESRERRCHDVQPANLAYVIYTSGSSGRPKGVAVEHASLVHYLDWAGEAYAVTAGRGSVVQSSIAFDLTLTSALLPLTLGSTVTLLPEGDSTAALAAELTTGPALSLVKITPAQLELVNRRLPPGHAAGAPHALVVGGEALRAETVQPWLRAGTRVVNEYGPTETVVGCCVYEVPDTDAPVGRLPIGWPIARTRLYVLDAHLHPVPLGARGELFIAGAGVARGYLGRPALTAERFLPDPFGPAPGGRMYRTGDVVRRRPDGCLEYLGRNDAQVKLRGHRIELAEVEAALVTHAGALAAAAAIHADRLVAYLVVDGAAPLDASALRRRLQAHVPEPMIPSLFVPVAALPLTPNGKLDRRALPEPVAAASGSMVVVAPRDPLEVELTALWEQVLKRSEIGVTDSFFDLGGHSLLAAELQWRLGERFGRELSLSMFFEQPTIEAVARWLRSEVRPQRSRLVALRPQGLRPPIFLVHPLSGEIECFAELASRLGPNQPVFALRDLHLSEIGRDPATLEELARRHVDALVACVPAGPFLLAGYSFGSILAFEMAHQLRDRGLPVGLLALLDGTSPLLLQRAGERGDVVPLAGMARDMARVAGVELSLPNSELAGLSREAAFERILAALKTAGLLEPDQGRAWLEALLSGLRTRSAAIMGYRPRVYPERLTLFRTTQVEPESARAWLEAGIDVRARTRGWDVLSSQPIDVHLIPGYHATLLSVPAVDVLAERLRAVLDAAEDAFRSQSCTSR